MEIRKSAPTKTVENTRKSDGYVVLENVYDTRTEQTHSVAIVKEKNAQYFAVEKKEEKKGEENKK